MELKFDKILGTKIELLPNAEALKFKFSQKMCIQANVGSLRGDYTLLLSNFVLDITFKQIH